MVSNPSTDDGSACLLPEEWRYNESRLFWIAKCYINNKKTVGIRILKNICCHFGFQWKAG